MLEEIFDDEINDVWHDADGNQDDSGCYDAGGAYYHERGAVAADAYHDRLKELES
jgi:hypothetical protein